MAVRQRGNVRSEAHVQSIYVENRAAGVVQADHIAAARAAGENRLDAEFREVGAILNEVAKKGISGSQRKKSKRSTTAAGSIRENSVHDFKAGSVTAHSDEFAETIGVSAVGEHSRFSRGVGLPHFQREACDAQSFQRAGR